MAWVIVMQWIIGDHLFLTETKHAAEELAEKGSTLPFRVLEPHLPDSDTESESSEVHCTAHMHTAA